MLDWEFSSEKSLPFSAPTDASSLCAPLQLYPSHHAAPSTTKSCRQNSPSMARAGVPRRAVPARPPPSASGPSISPTASWASSNDGSLTVGAGSTVRSSTSPAPTATDPSPVLIHNITQHPDFYHYCIPSIPFPHRTPHASHTIHPVSVLPALRCISKEWMAVGVGRLDGLVYMGDCNK